MPKQRITYHKNLTAAKGAGAFQSAWLSAGFPGAGSAPPAYTAGSGYTCSSATAGAIKFSNATVKNSLAKWMAGSNLQCTLNIYDRLWSCGGMGFAASTYTVTTPGSLPARITDDGIGCELWVEQFVASGAASGTLTATYAESTTGTSRTGVISAVVSAPVAGQMQRVPLNVNSAGIRSLTSVQTSATWTSGTFGMSIMKLVAEVPITSNSYSALLDYAQCGLASIPDDACLMFQSQQVSAAAIIINGSLHIIDSAVTSVDDIVTALAGG